MEEAQHTNNECRGKERGVGAQYTSQEYKTAKECKDVEEYPPAIARLSRRWLLDKQ